MLTACDFLDEYNPNSVTVGNYYTSEEDIVASLTSPRWAKSVLAREMILYNCE